MENIIYSGRNKAYMFFLMIIIIFVFSACATDMATKEDPFFDKWQVMSKTATGHSPGPSSREISISGERKISDTVVAGGRDGFHAKRLPTQNINLKMRQADVKAVLRALAKIEGKNILIKNEIKGEVTVDFKEVPWDQAFTSILRNHGLEYEWENDIIRVTSLEDMERDQKRRAIEAPVTVVVPVNYADAKKLMENLQEFITKDKDKPRGSVRVDEHSNSLIIQALRDDLRKMVPVIEKIDKPTSQILIKANIVEATKDTARNLGVLWGGMYRAALGDSTSGWVMPGGTTAAGSTPVDPIGGRYTPSYGSPGLSGHGFALNVPGQMPITGTGALGLMFGTIGGNILEMQLNALQKEGKLNILSSPSITTLDNQTAYTENGEKVPYVTEEVGTGGATTRSVKFENVVLRLEITPHVIDGKNLKMKVVVKKDEVDNTRNVQGNPYIYKKETSTNLIVEDGETIVISGLTKHKRQDTEIGIPWVKDVPVFGWLFKSVGKSESMEEVLIFITPKILPIRSVAAVPPAQELQSVKQPSVQTQ